VHPAWARVRSTAYEHLGRSIGQRLPVPALQVLQTVLARRPTGLLGSDKESAIGIVWLGRLRLKRGDMTFQVLKGLLIIRLLVSPKLAY